MSAKSLQLSKTEVVTSPKQVFVLWLSHHGLGSPVSPSSPAFIKTGDFLADDHNIAMHAFLRKLYARLMINPDIKQMKLSPGAREGLMIRTRSEDRRHSVFCEKPQSRAQTLKLDRHETFHSTTFDSFKILSQGSETPFFTL